MFRQLAIAAIATLGLGASTAHAQVYLPRVTAPRYTVQTYWAPTHPVHHYHVQYRQWDWRERVFTSPIEAREYDYFMSRQGYETTVVRHGHHVHVRYRQPTWQTYRSVSSDQLAHELERNLESRGYQSRVVHH